MAETEFDFFSDNYEQILEKHTRLLKNDLDYLSEYKVLTAFNKTICSPKRILEYGCGIGRNLPFLQQYYSNSMIYGCDISEKSIQRAQEKYPFATLFLPEEMRLTSYFDLIFVSNVLHHIKPENWHDVIHAIRNYLKQTGELFIFEHNPYNPITRQLVNTCPLDVDACLLKPWQLKQLLKSNNFEILETKYALFFPSVLAGLRKLEKYLEFLPIGGQYFIHAYRV